ncbi:LPS export ABC transporter ATP-binding protein [Sandaracinobacteroides sp. A072]|uniref:LPS export ABC transporter ATP-binding protein n=1 Tax=Sandaracinobacteroides sp. A072 TaxID=3461146 RepID=UPI0040432B35
MASRPYPGNAAPAISGGLNRGLQATCLCKAYGRQRVLQSVTMHLRPGEIVGLFGRSGAGKTHCFRALMGMLSLDSGHVELNGADITGRMPAERARLGVTLLPQETSIFQGLTVAGNIAMVLELHEPDPEKRATRLETLMQQFRIDHLRDTPAPRLSGGERRRCEIARAMAVSPSFVLLDEPFAGIDPLSIITTRTMVATLRDLGVGVLIADQNVHEMLQIIDRAYVLSEGVLIFEGTGPEMLADSRVHDLYLGEMFED